MKLERGSENGHDKIVVKGQDSWQEKGRGGTKGESQNWTKLAREKKNGKESLV